MNLECSLSFGKELISLRTRPELLRVADFFNTKSLEQFYQLISNTEIERKLKYSELDYIRKGFIQNAIDSIINKLNSGIKYIPQIIISSQFIRKKDYHHLSLKVEDNGQGIEPSIKEKILTQEVSTKKNEQNLIGGCGFHLLASQEIVERYGGSIQFFNKGLGEGAIFLYEVPLQ